MVEVEEVSRAGSGADLVEVAKPLELGLPYFSTRDGLVFPYILVPFLWFCFSDSRYHDSFLFIHTPSSLAMASSL